MELIVVLVIALLVLGPKRLPEAGKSVGRSMREFKDAISGNRHDDEKLTGGHSPPLGAGDPSAREEHCTGESAPPRIAAPAASTASATDRLDG